jgi:hypothetical protein
LIRLLDVLTVSHGLLGGELWKPWVIAANRQKQELRQSATLAQDLRIEPVNRLLAG